MTRYKAGYKPPKGDPMLVGPFGGKGPGRPGPKPKIAPGPGTTFKNPRRPVSILKRDAAVKQSITKAEAAARRAQSKVRGVIGTTKTTPTKRGPQPGQRGSDMAVYRSKGTPPKMRAAAQASAARAKTPASRARQAARRK